MAELAQALRRQQQVVVVQPHGRPGRDQLARGRRERAVDLPVAVPLAVHESHVLRERVEERPQRPVAEAVVIAAVPLLGEVHPGQRRPRLVVEPEGAGFLLGRDASAPAQPQPAPRAERRLQRRDQPADVAHATGLARLRRAPQVRQPVRHDE